MNFITFQLKKRREDAALQASMPSGKTKKSQQEKAKAIEATDDPVESGEPSIFFLGVSSFARKWKCQNRD